MIASMLFFGCMSSMFYMITAWLAPLVQAAGMSHAQSGLVLTLFTIIQIPVSFLIPVIVSRTGNRNRWLFTCALAELVGIALLLVQASPWLATVFLGIGAGGLFPLALLIPIEEADSAQEATSWSAVMQFGGYMLGSLGPVLIGLAVDLFGDFTFALVAMLVIIGCLLLAISKLGPRQKESTRQRHTPPEEKRPSARGGLFLAAAHCNALFCIKKSINVRMIPFTGVSFK